MFGWLFGTNRRLVFHYRDGSHKRSADPIEIERAFEINLGKDWRGKIASLARPIPDGLVGTDEERMQKDRETLRLDILKAINVAFDVFPYKDGNGLTEIERFGLLDAFNRFCLDLIELARPFVSAQQRASPGPEPSPTVSGSEST